MKYRTSAALMALNMELIVSVKPDLVLASPLTPAEQIADLEKMGLKILVIPNPKTFEDLYETSARWAVH